MKALQYLSIGAPPEIVELPDPVPGAGELVLQVTAAGLCHSDLFIMGLESERFSARYPLPLTLGHEGVGKVVATGPGVTGVSIGDAMAVYAPWGCGVCAACAAGKENYCSRMEGKAVRRPGSLAEYMLIDSVRHLVPLGHLDPVESVALTDAGLTPYHAIKKSLHVLGPGSTAVVIGVGGLGHVALQIIRAMTSSTVIAVDLTEEKLRFARAAGAHQAVLSHSGTEGAILELTAGRGADAVFDFVGSETTAALAGAIAATEGEISMIGLSGGAVEVGVQTTRPDVTVRAPYWGSRAELFEVLELARSGQIKVHVEAFGMNDAAHAYELIASGEVLGRVVVVPGG
ncbi:NAD(P)-dependent alcohol dehydrogenase [Arthrobacter sp. NPDC080073]|uniref:NAD(P)-dependent alcohol dehydrogenase n=1 Tax=Arthrobacter sp. NPDC080073 TaxID=3155919 RepID=UPI00343400F6